MTDNRWYNSEFARYLGEGLAIAVVCLGLGYGYKGCHSSAVDVEIQRSKANQIIQCMDINGNGVIDQFYVIDGKIAVVEFDGKPVLNSLDSRVLEK